MTSGPSKRRRSSAEEGPTIYKCDQLLRMLEEALRNRSKRHATTDLVKFLGAYLPVRTEANGTTRPKSDDDENPASARFHSFCKQLAVALGMSKDFILQRITQELLQDETQLKELCDHLTAASEHYVLAMSLLKDKPQNLPVTIRIGTTNLINMRVLPTVLEAVRQRFRISYPDVQLRFVQTILDSDELLFGAQPLAGVDAIVACCLDARAATLTKSELVASMPLRCCLLRQRDSNVPEPGNGTLENWEKLRGAEIVALASRRKHFDVPWFDIEAMVESVEEVPTLLEAHARVATSDAWTFSYRELMNDVDERTLQVLDFPKDVHRQIPLIVAVLPKVKRRRSTRVAPKETDAALEKTAALAMLKECLQIAFEDKKATRSEAEELTNWLSRFPYSYHLSDCAATPDSPSTRVWFAGQSSLQCTTNGNLTGAMTIGSPCGAPLNLRVFGRPISHHNGTVWHLHWRGEDPREECGVTNMVVSRTDLSEGPLLIGSWIGRSSWTEGDVRLSGGPFILHTRGDLTPKDLRQIVKTHQHHAVPDLRELANDLIPIMSQELPPPPRRPR